MQQQVTSLRTLDRALSILHPGPSRATVLQKSIFSLVCSYGGCIAKIKVPAYVASAWLSANCFHLESLRGEGQREQALEEVDPAMISTSGPHLAGLLPCSCHCEGSELQVEL